MGLAPNQFLSAVGTVTVNLLNAGGGASPGTSQVNLVGGAFRLATDGIANNAVSDASKVDVAASATLNLNGEDETIGSLSGSGTVNLPTVAITENTSKVWPPSKERPNPRPVSFG